MNILPSLHEFPMLMCLILLPPQSQNYLAGMITGSISLAQSGRYFTITVYVIHTPAPVIA
jgi:hypothetical protein